MRKGSIIILGLACLALAGCSKKNKPEDISTTIISTSDGTKIVEKKLPFYNISEVYPFDNSTITTYYFNDSQIPYVSIDEYVNNIGYYPTGIECLDNNKYEMKKDGNSYLFTVNPEEEKITIGSYNFYSIDDKEYSMLPEYSDNLRMTLNENRDNAKEDVIDISKYNLYIEEVNGKAVIPFHVVSAIFSMESYYFVNYFGTSYSGISYDDSYHEFDTTPTMKLTNEYMTYNYNILDFVFNELYGLNGYFNFNVSDKLAEFKTEIMDPKKSSHGVERFIQSLEDLHSWIDDYDHYNGYNITYSDIERSKRNQESKDIYSTCYTQYVDNEYSSYVELNSDTALITFNSFYVNQDRGADLIIRESMEKALNKGIKNIVFNVTTNGGGDTFSLAKILGLMTNDDIVFEFKNTKTGLISQEIFKCDADFDGSYADLDAYDFNYYILCSGYTFSCANDFVNYCKEKKMAKIIGQKSGGGGCSIAPFTTPLCMTLCISSLCGLYDDNNNLIELGIDVDYEIELNKILDKSEILNAIDEVSKEKN